MKVLTMKMEILLEPTSNKLLWVFNSLVHSFRALYTLRCSGLRTASAATKPCQGDSSESYWKGYLRKGQKTKPKRQNQTRNGKAWKRHSQVKAQV
ncbi:hypothetical protein Tco_1096464 [Tanacetum coccineum]